MTRRSFPLLAMLPLAAFATTLIPHTVAQRAMAADRVAVVEVLERQTVAEAGDARRLKTHTRLQVREDLRGKGPAVVTLVQLGGTHGDQAVVIPGDASFEVGERALVFLHCPLPERCYLVAMGAGKLPVVDADTVVVHDLFTDEYARRSLKSLAAELRALPPGKVRGPGPLPGAKEAR